MMSSHGPDGADRALLSAVDVDHDFRQFSTLIIGSGDHAFARLARQARSRGARVELVVGAGQLSRDLASTAVSIHCLAA